jgi:predicted phosphodiesterase
MTDTPVIHRLRILHLSDLHHRGPRETEPERRRRVLGRAWLDNLRELREQDGAFDLVVCTGDVAFSGASDEYSHLMRHTRVAGDGVDTWLDTTLTVAGCDRSQLFVVPGNHDIERNLHDDAWRAVRGAWSEAGADDDVAFARWLVRGGRAPRGIDPALRDRILERQSAYRAWLRDDLGRSDLLPEPRRSQLGYRASPRLARLPFPVHILGLDSAWLAGDDSDARKLRLTDDQILRLGSDDDGEPLSGLRIALVHHPLGELADGERARRLLQELGIGLMLSGHLHTARVSEIVEPDGRLRDIATGCLYQHDRHPNAVTALTLQLDDTGGLREIEFRFRSWSNRGFWHDENGLYRGTQNGRLVWTAAGAPTSQPPAASPPPTERAAPPAVHPAPRKHVILFLAANPRGTSRVALDEECAAIERELRMTSGRDDFDFRSRWVVDIDDMMRHLNELEPAIVHFSGHGGDGSGVDLVGDPRSPRRDAVTAVEAGILVEGEQRQPQFVTARALAKILASTAPATRVVVLNACFTEPTADALRNVVDCVVGMRGAIADDAARAFAVGFYRALGYRRSVGNAVEQAIAALAARALVDGQLPVCLTRDGLTADRIVLSARAGGS